MRKPRFLRLVSLMMALLLLISSMGLVIVDHECLMRGKSQSVWIGLETCSKSCQSPQAVDVSKHDHTTSFDKVPCCQEKAQLVKLEVQSQSGWGVVQVFTGIQPFPEFLRMLRHPTSPGSVAWPIFSDSGPPAYTVAYILAILCTWVI